MKELPSKCPFTGKYGYHTRKKAKQRLKHLRRLQGYHGGLYICKECGLWHIGGALGCKEINAGNRFFRGSGGRGGGR